MAEQPPITADQNITEDATLPSTAACFEHFIRTLSFDKLLGFLRTMHASIEGTRDTLIDRAVRAARRSMDSTIPWSLEDDLREPPVSRLNQNNRLANGEISTLDSSILIIRTTASNVTTTNTITTGSDSLGTGPFSTMFANVNHRQQTTGQPMASSSPSRWSYPSYPSQPVGQSTTYQYPAIPEGTLGYPYPPPSLPPVASVIEDGQQQLSGRTTGAIPRIPNHQQSPPNTNKVVDDNLGAHGVNTQQFQGNTLPPAPPILQYVPALINGAWTYVPYTPNGITSNQMTTNHNTSSPRYNASMYERVTGWKISFAGLPSENLEVFLKKLKIRQDACGIPDEELFRQLPVVLKGLAYNWWEERRDRFKTFEEVRQALMNRFSSPVDTRCRAISDIVLRTQGSLEKGADFLDAVRLMWSHSGNHNFSEAARLDIAFTNLRPEYHTMISRVDFSTFDELEVLVLDYDRRRSRPQLRPPPSASETIYPMCAYQPARYKKIDKNSETEINEINSINDANDKSSQKINAKPNPRIKNNKSSNISSSPKLESLHSPRRNSNSSKQDNQSYSEAAKSGGNSKSSNSKPAANNYPGSAADLRCFNCKQLGHDYKSCKKAREGTFCFKCGAKDVTMKTCPTHANEYATRIAAREKFKSTGNAERKQH